MKTSLRIILGLVVATLWASAGAAWPQALPWWDIGTSFGAEESAGATESVVGSMYALEIDGVDDYAASGNWDWSGETSAKKISIALWLRRDALENFNTVVSHGQETGALRLWTFLFVANGPDRWQLYNVSGSANRKQYEYAATDTALVGEYAHYAVTLNTYNNTMRIYFNGVESTPTKIDDYAISTIQHADLPLYIGAIVSGGTLYPSPGQITITGLRIAAYEWTPAQVAQLMIDTAPNGYCEQGHWRMDRSADLQYATDAVGSTDIMLGSTSGVDTNDPTWSSGYTSLGASGPVAYAPPVVIPRWDLIDTWLAWLLPPPAYAGTPTETVRQWVIDVADMDSAAVVWPDIGIGLGSGGQRLYGAAGDTVKVFSATMTDAQWAEVLRSCEGLLRDTKLDSTRIIQTGDLW